MYIKWDDKPIKAEYRLKALSFDRYPKENLLLLPGIDILCFKEAYDKKIIEPDFSSVIAVEYNKKIAKIIDSKLKPFKINYTLENKSLHEVRFKKDIDGAFIDLLGDLVIEDLKFFNEILQHNISKSFELSIAFKLNPRNNTVYDNLNTIFNNNNDFARYVKERFSSLKINYYKTLQLNNNVIFSLILLELAFDHYELSFYPDDILSIYKNDKKSTEMCILKFSNFYKKPKIDEIYNFANLIENMNFTTKKYEKGTKKATQLTITKRKNRSNTITKNEEEYFSNHFQPYNAICNNIIKEYCKIHNLKNNLKNTLESQDLLENAVKYFQENGDSSYNIFIKDMIKYIKIRRKLIIKGTI